MPSLEASPLEIFNLLNNLADTGHLEKGLANVQAGRWRPILLLSLRSRLESLSRSASYDSHEMVDLLRLVSRFPDSYRHFEPVVICVVDGILEKTTSAHSAQEQWFKTGPFNEATCVTEALRCLRRLAMNEHNESTEHLGEGRYAVERIRRLASAFHWHRGALEEIAEALDIMASTFDL